MSAVWVGTRGLRWGLIGLEIGTKAGNSFRIKVKKYKYIRQGPDFTSWEFEHRAFEELGLAPESIEYIRRIS